MVMGRQDGHLHHLADGPGMDQFAGLDRCADLQPLRVADRVDPAGLSLDPAHLGQLLQRGDARLVDHEVLAVPA